MFFFQKNVYKLQIFSFILFLLIVANAHREDECVEVGFARSSYTNIDQAYNNVKPQILETWRNEDEVKKPIYLQFTPPYKNVTRAAMFLESISEEVIKIIRKTRVGKRCQEKWLMRGLEKHVQPLIQMDEAIAEELGLVMSFRCMVGSPYPNVDGTCVNEKSPDQGAVGAKFLRLIPPVSGGNGFGLRESVNSEKRLPSARKVSQFIRRHTDKLKTDVTALFTQFSHFLALDTVDIPESPLTEELNCCESESPFCAPISIEKDDLLYKTTKCINFKRSAPAQAILGHRDFLTMVSTYFDANPLYGSDNDEAFEYKTGFFGYLKYPESMESEEWKKRQSKLCEFPKSFKNCFGIGKRDQNNFIENLRLLLLLEHNYIADLLTELNPHFDDSLLYNEARRILIAEYNMILYNEFVPQLIGRKTAEKHSLLPGSQGPGAGYIPEVNPGILVSHSVGSFRNPSMYTEWKSEWGKTDILDPRHYESVRGQNYVDILAMDVQRGRDHGVASLNTWKAFCDSGNHFNSWDDVAAYFSKEIAEDLKVLYDDEFQDIDLLIALLETPEEDAVVGKIFTCLLADQFARLKSGNRLFWEFDSSLLTVEQRDSIKSNAKSAALLCRHFKLQKVAKNPFKVASEENPEVDCSEFPKFDITPWTDASVLQEDNQIKSDDKESKEGEGRKEESKESKVEKDDKESKEGEGRKEESKENKVEKDVKESKTKEDVESKAKEEL